jgi:PAS domain S-box-containing protein
MTGLEVATGKTAKELVPNLEPFWIETYGKVALTGVPARFENQSKAMNRWFEVSAFRIGEAQSHKFAILFTNISDRKRAEIALQQSEERYRYLVQSIPQLVWTANAAGILIDLNQRWSDYTGLTLAQIQIQGWESIVHPDDLPHLTNCWSAAKQAKRLYQAEGRMRRSDGVYRWHLHKAIPQINQQSEVIKWFGTATDIHDRVQLEIERDAIMKQEQAARIEAERANRLKDEFLAVLSHELRSPLNPILGWTKLLQSGKLNPIRTTEALTTIERNAKLQAQLIEDLLDISRIMQGKLTLNSAPVNLAFVIEDALETVRLAAEAKNIQFNLALDATVGEVLGDGGRLQQVLWNLLSNAVKFTPTNGQVTIVLSQIDAEVQIQISDTGKGINPEFLPYVFEYFRQEDGSTTRKFGGLGLGLAIARQIVEMHGGRIWADSPAIGGGATFTFKLPILNREVIPTASPAIPASSPSDCVTPLSGIRILVVDDTADTRELLAFLLEDNGAIVLAASCATEALQALEEFQPDILLSDIGMPQMDGYELIRSIRALPAGRAIPAIALTAYAGEIDQKQAIAAGFQRHLAKPLAPDRIISDILELAKQTK